MAYLALNEIRHLHLELTSQCNLLCPQCARIVNGKRNSEMPIQSLSLSELQSWLSRDFLRQIRQILLCGNYGDPAAAPELLEILQWFRTSGVPKITMVSNGSLRPASWWADLARLLNQPGDRVAFSIDGIGETNAIYRIQANWDRLMDNVRSFIGAGGRARWDYLAFPHNQHQIESAQSLSRELGFLEFNLKQTARRIQDHHYRGAQLANTEGDANAQRFQRIIDKYGSWKSYVQSTPIRCKKQGLGSLYIDFEAELWPCCWTGAPKYFPLPNTQREQQAALVDRYGKGFNSLRLHSLEEILNHEWFRQGLELSWQSGGSPKQPRLMVCGRTCGDEYEFSSMRGTVNSEVQQWTS